MKKTTKNQASSGADSEIKLASRIVGIGSSAGGLEALTQLVSHLTPEFSGAMIIAQHLAPHAKSMMVDLLARHCALPLLAAEDGLKILERHVYVVPPNNDIDIVHDTIVLTKAGIETRPKPSVDNLFTSLARAYGKNSIGVILSGTGSDGTEGVRAIHNEGGLTIVQDGLTAKYDGMPRSAVDTGLVDWILSPQEIARTLATLIEEHETKSVDDESDTAKIQKILATINQSQNVDFSQYRISTIRRRIEKRMASLSIANFTDYNTYLTQDPAEAAKVANEFLISVTHFFRDPQAFTALEADLKDAYYKKEPGVEFRVWVAGCATGEEAYSIALILSEICDQVQSPPYFKIFATDLDHGAVLEARNGVYSAQEIQNIPAKYRQKYFENTSEDGKYSITKRIRDLVVFARHNLVQNPPFVKLDLVTCRNVLIYFEPELQKKVLETFHYALNSEGLLFLGKAETLGPLAKFFEVIHKKEKIFRKLNGPSSYPFNHAPGTLSSGSRSYVDTTSQKKASVISTTAAEARIFKLLKNHDLASVVINSDGQIIQIIGDISPYVGFVSQTVDFRLSNLLAKEIGIELPLLMRKTRNTKELHKSRKYPIKGSEQEHFCITVSPASDSPDDSDFELFLVAFQKVRATSNEKRPIDQAAIPKSLFQELEEELRLTKENLQAVVEELGVSNEELQSLNEELSSTNEEMQASNEELETTNEELQSTNEELSTVNDELGAKSADLRQLNVDLENIQNSIGSPLIIVDRNLRILRFNSDSHKIFSVSQADIGRDLTTLSAKCEIPEFKEKISAALQKGTISESVARGPSGIYQVRFLPSLDEKGHIVGALLIFFDNTSLIQTQERLATGEAQTNAIVNSSGNLICLKDNLGKYILTNKAYNQFFGAERDSLIGKTDREVFDKNMAMTLRDSDLEVLMTGNTVRKEEKFKGPQGNEVTFLVNRFPIRMNDKSDAQAVGMIAIDISAKIESEKELRHSETRYRAIVEDQAVFVCRHKANGEMTYCNSVFGQHFGIADHTLTEKRFIDFVSSDQRDQVQKEISAITHDNQVAQYEYQYRKKDGSVRWIRWIHRGIFDSKGHPVDYQAVGFDITDYRLQADQLRQKESIYTGIFGNTSDFITILGYDGHDFRIESLNQPAANALGLAASQVIGKGLEDFVEATDATKMKSRYLTAIVTKQPRSFEEEFIYRGATRYYSTTVVPIPDAEGKITKIATLSRDISGHKSTEADLRKAKEVAEVANKAKSDFLATMSHELRTPLNVVLGMTHFMQETTLNDEQTEFMSSIHRSGKVLLSLIEDILDISKIEAGKIKLESQPFLLPSIPEDVAKIFSLSAQEKNIKLILQIDRSSEQYVVGDADRLRQIFVNLIGNAVKFTDRGSVEIHVSTKDREQAGEQVFLFQIKDSGPGIKKEDYDKIFKKFSQVSSGHSRKFGGSGLGLMISKHLVHLMNGDIGFESDFGKGSLFWFTIRLPLTTKEEFESRQQRLLLSSAINKQKAKMAKILAVDDNIESLSVIKLILQRMGHQPMIAKSGFEALDILSKNHVDLILMDIQMPGMDGLEATRKIRSLETAKADVPIIALTANAMAGDSDKGIEAGMNDYLTKPIKIQALRGALDLWLQKSLDKEPK